MTEDTENMRQNHPELIVRDLLNLPDYKLGSADELRHVLKYRGVNKWFRVRKLLIQLKERWKVQAQALEQEIKSLGAFAWLYRDSDPKLARKYRVRMYKAKGYRAALVDVRQQVRALTHSPRDVDFPTWHPRDFGEACKLPEDFPRHPHKRYFWKRRG